MATIYCDESGFSGPNLYHDKEPFFVYASVAIEPEDAERVIQHIRSFFKNFQGEVGISALVKSERGQAALGWLLEEHRSRTQVWFANKRFATAAKFFEYIFQPVLCDNDRLFYENNFHRFIANLLYMGMAAAHIHADEMLADLQHLLRTKDVSGLKRLLSVGRGSDEQMPFGEIADFAIGYKERFMEEVQTLDKWAMDLTFSALIMVSRAQAARHRELTIVCDQSKPLKDALQYAVPLIAADLSSISQELGWSTYSGGEVKEDISLKSSTRTPGVQIADLFAGMTRLVLTEPESEFCKKYAAQVRETILQASVTEDFEYVDLRLPAPRVNLLVLEELARRARIGADPLPGMHAFYMMNMAREGFGLGMIDEETPEEDW